MCHRYLLPRTMLSQSLFADSQKKSDIEAKVLEVEIIESHKSVPILSQLGYDLQTTTESNTFLNFPDSFSMQDFDFSVLEGFTADGQDSLMLAQAPTPKASGTHDDINETITMYLSPNSELDLGEFNFLDEPNVESKNGVVSFTPVLPATVSVENGAMGESAESQPRRSKRPRLEPKLEPIDYEDGESSDDDVRYRSSSKKSYSSGLYSDHGGQKKNSKCMTKNAVAARENRQKKKMYIHNLERKVAILTNENGDLQKRLNQSEKEASDLKNEVEYLSAIIANVDGISALVKHVSKAPGISFIGTSLNASGNGSHCKSTSPPVTNDVAVRRSSRIHSKVDNPGICFHVTNNNVSLEFCKMCSSKAKHVIDKKCKVKHST